MVVTSLIRLSLVVHGVCLLSPCVTSFFCNNHTECASRNPNTPFCCGHILRFCAGKCNGSICNTDQNCGDGECCYNPLSYCTNKLSLCREQCLTKNDCPNKQFNTSKDCKTSKDCDDMECCKDGTCHEMKDCKDKENLSITATIVIVIAVLLTILAIVFGVLACCGCFKRKRFPGVVVHTQPQQEEQIASSTYIKLDDMIE